MNQYNTFLGEPGYFQEDYRRYQQLGAEQVRRVVETWLNTSRRVALSFVPESSARPQGSEPNREQQPGIGSPRPFQPPALAVETLAPGLTVAVAERHDLPKVAVSLLLKSGSCSDPLARPGVAWMTTAMLDEGTRSRTTLEIQAELDRLGASFGSGAESENCHLALEVLKEHLEPAVRLLSDLVLNANFPAEELGAAAEVAAGPHSSGAEQSLGPRPPGSSDPCCSGKVIPSGFRPAATRLRCGP